MMTVKEDPELLTIEQAARLRGVGADSIRKLIRRGRLPFVNLYGRMLINRQDILAFEKNPPGPQKSATKKGK
jgi:excisionase family DNA binding protein